MYPTELHNSSSYIVYSSKELSKVYLYLLNISPNTFFDYLQRLLRIGLAALSTIAQPAVRNNLSGVNSTLEFRASLI